MVLEVDLLGEVVGVVGPFGHAFEVCLSGLGHVLGVLWDGVV